MVNRKMVNSRARSEFSSDDAMVKALRAKNSGIEVSSIRVSGWINGRAALLLFHLLTRMVLTLSPSKNENAVDSPGQPRFHPWSCFRSTYIGMWLLISLGRLPLASLKPSHQQPRL